MSILVDRHTRVLVQGLTGAQGAQDTRYALDAGTQVVCGVTPGKGGAVGHGLPVYHTVAAAAAVHAATAAVVYAPPLAVRDAVYESLDAGLRLIVVLAENVPVHDAAAIRARAERADAVVVGCNTNGIITPRQCKLGGIGGDLPERIFVPGRIGIVSRSGGMSAELGHTLKCAGYGVSTAISMGGDMYANGGLSETLRSGPRYRRGADLRRAWYAERARGRAIPSGPSGSQAGDRRTGGGIPGTLSAWRQLRPCRSNDPGPRGRGFCQATDAARSRRRCRAAFVRNRIDAGPRRCPSHTYSGVIRMSQEYFEPTGPWEAELTELQQRSHQARQMGGPEAVAKYKARGRQTAHERIDALLDAGSFREMGRITGKGRYDADGHFESLSPVNAIIGTGRIGGRKLVVSADDYTIRAGSSEGSLSDKWVYAERMALTLRMPIVRLVDTAGGSVKLLAQMQGTKIPGYSNWPGAELLRTVPVVGVALGACAGLGAVKVLLSHFSVMVRDQAGGQTGVWHRHRQERPGRLQGAPQKRDGPQRGG